MSDTPRLDAIKHSPRPNIGDVVRLCETLERENAKLREALDSMARQFAYAGNGIRTTGGLSALEEAFDALGWSDPQPLDDEEMCDEPGCKEPTSCGFPTPTGYRRTCGEHYRAANAAEGVFIGEKPE